VEPNVARKLNSIDEPAHNLYHMAEVRLCHAVLMSAINDYLSPKQSSKKNGRHQKEDAVEWFTKPAPSHVFSFPAVCETLNLDSHAVWRELQNQERGQE
jgi:hypothetical protein